MEHKNIFFLSIVTILIVLNGYLIYNTTDKTDIINQQTTDLKNAYNQINIISGKLSNAIQNIQFLNSTIRQRESEISSLSQEVKEKESAIVSATQDIQRLEEENKNKEQELNNLYTSLQNVEGNKIIKEDYHNTLVLYENELVYAKMSPIFSQVSDDPEDYSKLGIPFFYFKDDTVLTDEEKQILGAYYTLYNYILIYNATSDVSVIYHEIGHIIYKNFFADNPNNLDIWKSDYAILKENHLLSSEYAYTSEQEGFSEEYAAYKTNSNPNQPIEIKEGIFEPIDAALRG